jgi:hypothetical protein
MCDYSLLGLPNRLASDGEELVTHRFSTGSIGLASPQDIDAGQSERKARIGSSWWSKFKSWASPPPAPQIPAVCIPPGTSLVMSHIPDRVRREFALGTREDVTFAQLSAEAFRYRDAIRLASGKYILLQAFPCGARFQVVALAPAELKAAVNERETLAVPAAHAAAWQD